MVGFLPETQGNLCGEHTVGSCEPALTYRQIAGRDERGKKGRHSLPQARALTGAGNSRGKRGRVQPPSGLVHKAPLATCRHLLTSKDDENSTFLNTYFWWRESILQSTSFFFLCGLPFVMLARPCRSSVCETCAGFAVCSHDIDSQPCHFPAV